MGVIYTVTCNENCNGADVSSTGSCNLYIVFEVRF